MAVVAIHDPLGAFPHGVKVAGVQLPQGHVNGDFAGHPMEFLALLQHFYYLALGFVHRLQHFHVLLGSLSDKIIHLKHGLVNTFFKKNE